MGSRCFRRFFLLLILAVLLLQGTGLVSAHAPLGVGSNEDIANATFISNPEKSIVIYTELHESNETQYYLFPMQKGQILYGSLQVPGPGSKVPDLVIIGPGIESSGTVPPFIEVPDGSGAMVIPGRPPGNPDYEPFTPQPIYEVARFNVTVPGDGDYYIAIAGSESGKYSLAPGFLEEFTAREWLLIPYSVVAIHLWEGQSFATIIAPLILVMIGGIALIVLYPGLGYVRRDPVAWLILISGLLYLGGAAMTGLQVVHTVMLTGYTPAVLVTLLFILGPVVLGIAAILTGIRPPRPDSSLKTGIVMVIIGLLGLLVWAGFVLGPLLAIAAGLIVLARYFGKTMPA
ncbi:MAG: hypothetical protein WCB46_03790 [Methanoregula sp.]